MLAMLLGGGGGFGIAFLREYLQKGIKTGEQVEQSFGFPVIGVIPFVHQKRLPGGKRDNRLLRMIIDAPLSQFSESVRAMRVGLELANGEGMPKAILVTSSLPFEGKSTVAMLLAASIATSNHKIVTCANRRFRRCSARSARVCRKCCAAPSS